MSKPVTPERIEAALDILAREIVAMPKHADKIMLIYQRLESDLEELRRSMDKRSALMSSVMRRIKQQQDRMVERS